MDRERGEGGPKKREWLKREAIEDGVRKGLKKEKEGMEGVLKRRMEGELRGRGMEGLLKGAGGGGD